jgi:Ricin-type beta-trefoil lectin domain-like
MIIRNAIAELPELLVQWDQSLPELAATDLDACDPPRLLRIHGLRALIGWVSDRTLLTDAVNLPSLGSAHGARLHQWTDKNGDNQWWRLVPATIGYHRLVNVRTVWCADVEGGSTVDGAKVIQWHDNGGSNQEWQIVDV